MRTHRGDREVDLIVVGSDGGVVAVEVKLSTTVHAAYRRPDGIAVVPVALLGP